MCSLARTRASVQLESRDMSIIPVLTDTQTRLTKLSTRRESRAKNIAGNAETKK